jgi:hypothetical protein
MNSTVLTALPQTLKQWLLRSMGWTAICVLPCAGLGYLFKLVADSGRSSGVAFPLTLLTIGFVLGSNLFLSRAFAGFNFLFQQARWCDWTKSAALSWFTVLVLVLVSWLFLDALTVLVMLFSWFDDGKGMSWAGEVHGSFLSTIIS